MPSVITHSVVGGFFGFLCQSCDRTWRFWLLSILCPVLPDADMIMFKFDVPYHHILGHRGLSHSFTLAFLLALLITITVYRAGEIHASHFWKIQLYFFSLIASHPLLDAFTDGGLGVAFFAPFDNTRYFFPIRPIHVAPLSVSRFFSEPSKQVLLSEMQWVWLPGLGVVLTTKLFVWLKHGRVGNS